MYNKPTFWSLVSVGVIIVAFSLILVLSSENNVHAQTGQTVTVHVYHLCDFAAINDDGIKCQYPIDGAGTKRSLLGPDEDFVLWPCQADDPQNFPPYDAQMNYGCGYDPVTGEWHYHSVWPNPVTLDVEEYVYDVLVPEMHPDVFPFVSAQAQSIAARTKGLRQGILDNSNLNQVFFPNTRTSSAIAVVDSTAGQVMQYAGDLIAAQFSSDHSGKWTTQNAFGHEYLKSVYDPDGHGGGHGEGLSQYGACRWIDGYNLAQPVEINAFGSV